MEIIPPPLLKFLATPLPSLVVDEENLVIAFGLPTLEMLPPSLCRPWLLGEENLFIGFGLPHFRNASAIAASW